MEIQIEFDEPIYVGENGEWMCFSPQYPGMIGIGQSKLESFEEFMISLKVKIAYDNKIDLI